MSLRRGSPVHRYYTGRLWPFVEMCQQAVEVFQEENFELKSLGKRDTSLRKRSVLSKDLSLNRALVQHWTVYMLRSA